MSTSSPAMAAAMVAPRMAVRTANMVEPPMNRGPAGLPEPMSELYSHSLPASTPIVRKRGNILPRSPDSYLVTSAPLPRPPRARPAPM